MQLNWILLVFSKEGCMTAWLINLKNVFFPCCPLICFVTKMRRNLSPTRKCLDFLFSRAEPRRHNKPHPSIYCPNHQLKPGRSALQPGQRPCWETFQPEELLPFLWQCLKPFCWQLVFPAIHCRSISFLISKSTWKPSIVSWDRKSFPIVVCAIIFLGCNDFATPSILWT